MTMAQPVSGVHRTPLLLPHRTLVTLEQSTKYQPHGYVCAGPEIMKRFGISCVLVLKTLPL